MPAFVSKDAKKRPSLPPNATLTVFTALNPDCVCKVARFAVYGQSYFEKVKGNPLKTDPSRKMHAEKLAEKNLSVLYTRFMPSVIYSYLVNIEKNEISIACELFNLFEATKMNTAHDRSKKWLKDEISAAQRHSLGNFDNKLGGASVNTKISSFYSFDENAVPIVEKYLAKWLLSPSTYNDKSVATLVEELRIHVLSNNRNRVMGTGSFEKYLFILDYYVYGLDIKQMSKTQKARIIENAIIYYYNTVSWENSNLFKESVKITPILKHNINSIMFDFITYFISLINSNEVDGKLGNRLYDYLNTKIISKDIQMMHFQDRFPEQYKILEDKFGKEIVPLGQRVEIE